MKELDFYKWEFGEWKGYENEDDSQNDSSGFHIVPEEETINYYGEINNEI